MAEVPRILGELSAPKFIGTDQYEKGKGATGTRCIYRLPKREVTLMAMSYSHKVSAQVYDKMEALENQVGFNVPKPFHQALILRLSSSKRSSVKSLAIRSGIQAQHQQGQATNDVI